MMQFDYKCYSPYSVNQYMVHNPLSSMVAAGLLKTGQCHVDHEGFDLNEIERAYYEINGLSLYHDDTWYKDGGQESGRRNFPYGSFRHSDLSHSEQIKCTLKLNR